MSERDHITSHLCMTKDIGVGGFLFGGVMMSWMDEAAAIYAHRYTGCRRLVTLKYTELVFRHPVRASDEVDFYAMNPRVGRTSFTFELVGEVEGIEVIDTICTFVSIDEAGRPTPIDAK